MTANEFDALCQDYVHKQLASEDARQLADKAKALVMSEVEKHGNVPANAEASRRVEGADWCATVTTGTSVEVNDGVVQELELLLSKAKLAAAFRLLFARRVEYSLVKGGEVVFRQLRLPRKHADRILQVYPQCFTVRKKTPSLKVEAILDVREREDKAARKLAKKGGSK